MINNVSEGAATAAAAKVKLFEDYYPIDGKGKLQEPSKFFYQNSTLVAAQKRHDDAQTGKDDAGIVSRFTTFVSNVFTSVFDAIAGVLNFVTCNIFAAKADDADAENKTAKTESKTKEA